MYTQPALRKIASKRRRLRLVWAAEGSFPDGQLHPSHPEGTTRPHFNPVKLYLQPGDAYFRDNRTFHRGTPSTNKVSLPATTATATDLASRGQPEPRASLTLEGLLS